jgi:hypothetical protein
MTSFSPINAGTAFAAAVVLSVVAVGCGRNSEYAEALPFKPDQWREGDTLGMTDRDAPRLRMADGLVADRALIGMTKPQILEMLGPPTDTDKFASHGLVYWLGPERGFMSIDSEWLIVDFDTQGISTYAAIIRD